MHNLLSRRSVFQILSVAGGLHSVARGQGANWPTKPVKFFVPYPAGGTPDTLARQIGGELGRSRGVPVVIENRPGASGRLGVQAMSSQAPSSSPGRS